MANLNRIILVGRLTADPENRTTVEGIPIAKFRLAVDRPWVGKDEEGADFIDVVAWRRLAEICGENLKKEQLVLVEGRIQNRSFEDQAGQRRWVTEVIAKTMTMLEKTSTSSVESSRVTSQENSTSAVESSPVAIDDEVADDSELESDLPF